MSYYEVSVEHSFRARHWLRLAGPRPRGGGGQEEPHEHTWRVTATLRSPRLAEDTGVVVDFVHVKRALQTVCDGLDGGDLNTIAPFSDGGASAERVAEHIASRLAGQAEIGDLLARVEVTEAPGCSAAFCP